MTAVIYNKRGKFAIKMAKNIASLKTQAERDAAIAAIPEGSREWIQKTVEAMLRGRTS